jgi:hypothetical protein
MQNTHTGGHEGQKMRPAWVKRGLYWRITRFRARGEYMIRLEWLNKYSLFTAHGRRGVRTPVHTWGAPPRPHLIVQC